MNRNATNPFTFGDLALDEAFTDREAEVRELTSDMRNGQNVLVYAPRRYGKSSLILRAAQEAMQQKVLVAYCDLMKTPTKERFAAALARTIYADIASPIEQAFERAADLLVVGLGALSAGAAASAGAPSRGLWKFRWWRPRR